MIGRRALIAAALATAGPGSAAGKVAVGAWGGDYATLLQQLVAAPLLKQQGIGVALDTASAEQRKARVLAERSRRVGSFDVVCLSDIDMYILSLPQLLRPDTVVQVPNLVGVYPALRVPYAVPQIESALVVIYRPDFLHIPLRGYADLWRPELRGRVGFADPLYREVLGAATLARGGTMSDYGPGMKAIASLKSAGARRYSTNEALGAALRSGEIWATLCWRARGYLWKRGGTKLRQVVPEEGAIPVVFQAGVPVNAPNRANGFAFLNALLGPKAQNGFATRMGYLPTVESVRLSPLQGDEIGFTTYQRERFALPDYDYLARNSLHLLTFWNRTFNL